MKLKHYFLALSALLSISHVSAAIVERKAPVQTLNFTEVKTDGTTMYMYNVGAKRFYRGANEWTTRASVGEEGYKMYFKQYTADGAWDGTTVEFWNWASPYGSTTFNEYSIFIDNEAGDCWVDRASQPNYLWNLTKNPNNGYYRLSMAAANPDYSTWYETDKPGTYFGWDAASEEGNNTRLWAFLDPTVETNHVDWAFVSAEDYEKYQTEDLQTYLAALEVFNASEVLKKKLQQAAELGITDLAAQEAVYNNLESTKKELDVASAEVQTLILQSKGDNADVTELITNPDFSQGTAGWEGSWTAVKHGCMEAYSKDWDAYQVIQGAPVGIYEVSVQGFYRMKRGQEAYDLYQSNEQTCSGYVYINNHLNEVKCVFDEPVRSDNSIFSDQALATGPESYPSLIIDAATGDSLYFPNDMLTAGEAFTAGMYQSSAVGIVAQQGDELRIGVKGTYQYENWVIWDNFKMVYRGKQPEYVKIHLEEAVAEANANLGKRIGKEIIEPLTLCKTTSEATLAGSDGEAMFNALVDLYTINDSAMTSISTISPVYLAAKELLIASKMSMGTQREEAATLAQTIMDGIEACTYNTDEMADLHNQIQNMKWQLPPVNGGSDQSGNYFCIASEVDLFRGFDLKLPVFMLNDDDITAFQCDIYLPEGLRLKMNEEEDYNITLSERATSSHSVATSVLDDGGIRIAVYSSKSKPFRENIGELFTLDLEYVEGATDPQLVEIRNIYLSTADEREFNPNNIGSVVTIKDYTLGDVNNDGIIELYDAAYISQYLRKETPWDFTFPAADTDADGKISIGDLVGVLNIVLGNGIVPPTDDDENQTANTLSIKDFEGYRTQSVPVSLINKDGITAYQCDIHLPEGLKIWEDVSVNWSSQNIEYELFYSSLSDSVWRLVAYSKTNEPFGDNGELFSLRIENAGTYEVKISNIRMSTAEGHEFGAPDASATLIMKNFTPGDVNNDGFVSLLDQVAKLNAEMGKPCAGYVEIAGEWYDIPNLCLYNDALPANGEGGVEQTDNVFKVEDADLLIGNELVLPIRMINKDIITAFQCDIYLSEGLQFETADIDRYTAHNNPSVTRPDGAIRWLSYGAQNSPFHGNDGDLLILKLTAKEGASETQTVEIRNIRLVTPDEREFTPADITANVTVKEYLPADANGDYKISIVDVVAVVNNLLGDESDNFVFKAADMDGNGKITIVDVVAVVNTLLGNSPKMATARAIMHSDIHVADAEVEAGETTTLYVKLDNATAYTAMQFNVELPEGLSIERVEMVGNTAHSVAENDGRIVAYSLTNRAFNGGEALMAITVKADETFMGTAHVDFTDVRVVSKDIVETVLGNASSTIIGGEANRINGTTATDVKVYTTNGRIIIETSAAQVAAVVSTTGVSQQVELVAGKNEVAVSAQGIYLVRIGEKSYKVKL